MSFDDEIRDALRAEADRVAPGTDAWPRTATASMSSRPPSRRWLLAAAAALVAVGAIAGATVLGEDEQGVDSVDQPGPSSTATTAESPVTDSTLVAPAGARPAELVAIDRTGHLIVVDVATGTTVRELAYVGDPLDEPAEGGPYFISGVEVSPDREWVYYETCCEPAVGSVRRVPYGGGESELVMDGSFPALSTDGRLIAASHWGYGVLVRATDPPEPELVAEINDPNDAERLAWSVDGGTLFADRFVGDVTTEVLIFDFDGSTLRFLRVLSPPGGQGWASPVGRADGNVLVDAHATDGSDTTSLATVLDPDTGNVISSLDLGDRARTLTYDSTGTWLLVTLEDSVRWFDEDGRRHEIPGAAGWLDADW